MSYSNVLYCFFIVTASPTPFAGSTKILFATGFETTDSDVIDTDDTGVQCSSQFPHPIPGIMGATGATLYGRFPLVCGGIVLDTKSYTSNCYVLGEMQVSSLFVT